MQENWIGKSRGLQFRFRLAEAGDGIGEVEVFTTRPDTIFGASFVAVAPDHPIAQAVAASDPKAAEFIAECKAGGTSAAEIETAERRAMRPAFEVVHPLDPEWRLPVYIANFVLMDYGTGAIFGVPGHDQRDYEFARQYGLPIRRVVAASADLASEPIGDEAESAPGRSGQLALPRRTDDRQAAAEVIRRAEAGGWGRGTVQYRLRDWGVSRQRYWGTPIPIIHCPSCGAVPVPREQLPVVLPEDVDFDIAGQPARPPPDLEACGLPELRRHGDARDRHARHLRRFELVLHPLREPAEGQTVRPRRGREMAPRRAIYRRRRACDPAPPLRPLLDPGARADRPDRSAEPFAGLFTQGMVTHETYRAGDGSWLSPDEVKRNGDDWVHIENGHPVIRGRIEKMSKSKRNVIDSDTIVDRYGADAARWFLLSDSPPERDLEWSEGGIEGAARFVQRVWRLAAKSKSRRRG